MARSPESNFVDLLRRRAAEHSDRRAFTRWNDDAFAERHLTYGELDARVRAVAASLQDRGLAGERVMLLVTPGLEYVMAFLGCLYAGAVPVPYYPPSGVRRAKGSPAAAIRQARGLGKVHKIAETAGIAAVIMHSSGDEGLDEPLFANDATTQAVKWLRVRDLAAGNPADWREFSPNPGALAFLQFTSGSTGSPRGVMVSHANLIHNSVLIRDAFGHTEGTLVGAIWLPPFHDMGLIGGILQPIFVGGRCVLLSPAEFLQRPRRWLEAVTRHKATTSGGPNFAFDLCARRVPRDQRDDLDLSSWSVAFTGAEPVRAATMHRFAEAFTTARFDRRAFFPCYGLAEATLAVTGGQQLGGAVVANVDRAALSRNEFSLVPGDSASMSSSAVQSLVACGAPLGDQQLCVVDPVAATTLPAGRIGEVWVRGPSVTAGYWRDPGSTSQTFGAIRADGAGPFLRTGDLGCLDDRGLLFIVGRSRDLIIIHGTNHHPADIEQTVESHQPVIRSGGVAAFGLDTGAGEQLVVVAELDPKSGASRDGRHDPPALNAITAAIRVAILEGHQVEPSAVLLVVAGSLPRTTSGKLERYACRDRFERGDFPVLYGWRQTEKAASKPVTERRQPETPFQHQLAAIWCAVLDTTDVGLDDDFFESGGHSLSALELVDRLSAETGVDLPVRTLIDHSKFEDLAAFLETAIRGSRSSSSVTHDGAARYEPFPLTDIQEAYLFGRSPAFELGGVAAQGVADFEAPSLDLERLTRAVDRLVAHHDMLRAVFRPDGQQQVLADVPPFPIQHHDLRGLAREEIDRRLSEAKQRLANTVLPAEQWPLFEILAFQLDQAAWRVLFRFDLLIADLHGLRRLWGDLGRLYADPNAELPASPLVFRDWVLHGHDRTSAASTRSIAYWHKRVPTLPAAPELPYVQPFRKAGTPRFHRRTATLGAAELTRLKERAASARVTPTAVLLAAFSRVLATWSRHPRFTLALTFFGRPHDAAAQDVVGDFTSLLLLPVETVLDGFLDAVRQVQQDLWETLDHRHAGGVWILREAARQQGRTAQALFPVVFTSALGQDTVEEAAPWSWLGDMIDSVSSTPQVTLDHQVQEDGTRLLLTWDTIDALFPAGLVDEMFQSYVALLKWVVHESDWTQRHPSLVPAGQLDTIAAANRTEVPTGPATLHGLFLKRAQAQPDQLAVISADGSQLTYRDVERRSRAVAKAISEIGAGPDTQIAVCMRKGWPQVIATMAILRTGAAYVPVDPALPEERRRHVLERVGARIVLTDRATDGSLAETSGLVTVIVDAVSDDDVDWTDQAHDWRQLAYIIFTSGSTGQPKGVMIDHRGAVNTIVDLNARFGIGPGDRVLGISGLGFDLSVYDIFGTLAAGGTLVLPAPGTERNPEHWLELLDRHRVTLWNSVPALFEMLCEHCSGARVALPPGLRLVWMSGDWIPVSLPDRARALKPDLEIISMGGATEGSIWSILYPIGAIPAGSRSIPYGRPLANQRMHVFDTGLVERPYWVAGDLYIGGEGVALGYWRDSDKTAASFMTHPTTGERLYRTGDVGRWLPDGNIEFMGREDGQVKIGGLRIELGEIEATLSAHPDVRQCAVVARHLDARTAADASAASTRQIVGFVVLAEGRSASEEDLRGWVAKKLPSGLVPRRIISLPALPLSANGKVDTNRLAVPALAGRQDVRSAPIGAEASSVRKIWADVLGLAEHSVGTDENFFDLGGTSVDLVRVAGSMSDLAGHNVSVLSLFDHPTVNGMAALFSVEKTDQTVADAAVRASRRKTLLATRRASVRDVQ